MSTKLKHAKRKTGIDSFDFLARRPLTQASKDSVELSLRLYVECMREKEADVQHWHDIANWINVCGRRCGELNRMDWFNVIKEGAIAMKEISARFSRVKGRMAASDGELDRVIPAINVIMRVLDYSTYGDLERISASVNIVIQEANNE